ncbi:MAG: hypothetical protein UH249_10615 [Acutalibacteraceae bacterium]|nr:hypothetical protein [Acutalibacteraceae bacterium]
MIKINSRLSQSFNREFFILNGKTPAEIICRCQDGQWLATTAVVVEETVVTTAVIIATAIVVATATTLRE